ncbi:hypothetical protein F442_14849 [Phytophthora nicotianae P10297]|uniref:Uncharacterized protein n=1 Tax=Phytophthora nicotianae P10297 TaxID=1317064 RepID=W2YR91_PHYNI|nr:hypothetical protein F442_14849 [Phytophthora nicotianae P10297]
MDTHPAEALEQGPKTKREKNLLAAAWYKWLRRMPLIRDLCDHQKMSVFRRVVAFTKLFLAQAFALDTKAEVYKY